MQGGGSEVVLRILGVVGPWHEINGGKLFPEVVFESRYGFSINRESPVWNTGPDGGTTRRGAQYVGDPARGKDGILWETALHWGGRRERYDLRGRLGETSMD